MALRASCVFVCMAAVAFLAGCGGSGEEPAAGAVAVLAADGSSIAPAQGQALLGDLDHDGNPTVGDAILILRIIVGLDPDNVCADANQSGGTDVGDAISVLRCLVGLDTWPIGVCVQGGFYTPYVEGAVWVYEETLPAGVVKEMTVTVVGTREIRGVECIDMTVAEDGEGVLAHLYGTATDADGVVIHAMGDGDGVINNLPDTPEQWMPGNPPEDFTSTCQVFPLGGTYDGTVVSMPATVDTPARTFNNAMQAQLTCQNYFTLSAYRMTTWLVPGTGAVRMLLEYNTIGDIDLRLISFTPGS